MLYENLYNETKNNHSINLEFFNTLYQKQKDSTIISDKGFVLSSAGSDVFMLNWDRKTLTKYTGHLIDTSRYKPNLNKRLSINLFTAINNYISEREIFSILYPDNTKLVKLYCNPNDSLNFTKLHPIIFAFVMANDYNLLVQLMKKYMAYKRINLNTDLTNLCSFKTLFFNKNILRAKEIYTYFSSNLDLKTKIESKNFDNNTFNDNFETTLLDFLVKSFNLENKYNKSMKEPLLKDYIDTATKRMGMDVADINKRIKDIKLNEKKRKTLANKTLANKTLANKTLANIAELKVIQKQIKTESKRLIQSAKLDRNRIKTEWATTIQLRIKDSVNRNLSKELYALELMNIYYVYLLSEQKVPLISTREQIESLHQKDSEYTISEKTYNILRGYTNGSDHEVIPSIIVKIKSIEFPNCVETMIHNLFNYLYSVNSSLFAESLIDPSFIEYYIENEPKIKNIKTSDITKFSELVGNIEDVEYNKRTADGSRYEIHSSISNINTWISKVTRFPSITTFLDNFNYSNFKVKDNTHIFDIDPYMIKIMIGHSKFLLGDNKKKDSRTSVGMNDCCDDGKTRIFNLRLDIREQKVKELVDNKTDIDILLSKNDCDFFRYGINNYYMEILRNNINKYKYKILSNLNINTSTTINIELQNMITKQFRSTDVESIIWISYSDGYSDGYNYQENYKYNDYFNILENVFINLSIKDKSKIYNKIGIINYSNTIEMFHTLTVKYEIDPTYSIISIARNNLFFNKVERKLMLYIIKYYKYHNDRKTNTDLNVELKKVLKHFIPNKRYNELSKKLLEYVPYSHKTLILAHKNNKELLSYLIKIDLNFLQNKITFSDDYGYRSRQISVLLYLIVKTDDIQYFSNYIYNKSKFIQEYLKYVKFPFIDTEITNDENLIKNTNTYKYFTKNKIYISIPPKKLFDDKLNDTYDIISYSIFINDLILNNTKYLNFLNKMKKTL